MTYRLIALDMDGTLLDADGKFPPGFDEILRAAHEQGVVLAPASGRQLGTLADMFDGLHGSPDGFIAENGAVVAHEGEIVSTVAIAVSSIVTTIIILLGVILIIPLTPVLESPALAPAFAQLLPALFGGLGVVFISKNAKLSIAPICLMLVLFIFVPALNAGTVGIMVPVSVLFTVGVARILYKKGIL